ncbi:ATP-grasp domain-containing protein [Kitasatospora purpeofusca]|uniref:ATP-grasp domain-containing protein n=1 Tax=Kitasatospora purpeofusca TaxID=67352 RepID=UPI00368CFC74
MAVVVVYDQGSASPREVIALGRTAPVLVALADSEHARQVGPLFEENCAGVVALAEGDGAVVARLREYGAAGILTFSERMLADTARLAGLLGLPFNTPETVRVLTDKAAQRRRLREAGVDGVRSALLTDADGWHAALTEVGLPAVVKPVRGEGSRNTVLVTDPDRGAAVVEEFLRAEPALVVEEFLQGADCAPFGDYVSVESAVTPGGIRHFAVTGKLPLAPPFRESGQFWPSQLAPGPEAEVVELADRALRALGVTHGLVHTEIKLTAAGPRLIEVNGRLGGDQTDLAARSLGLDLVALAGELALGRDVEPSPARPERVHFQYYTPGPTGGGRLTRVDGQAAVRALPGVDSYRLSVRPGTELAAGTGTTLLDMLCGSAADHRGMTALVERAVALLAYEFVVDGRSVTRTARDLLDHL